MLYIFGCICELINVTGCVHLANNI